jgi:hypothetical protein
MKTRRCRPLSQFGNRTMKNRTAISRLTKTSTSTGFRDSRGRIKKRVDVGALVSSEPERRLGHMPGSWMLSEIRKVFPNAKVVPNGL